jgi:hypothetical protein
VLNQSSRYWIEHPSLFVAPASEPDPEKRALAVLKWFLASLRGQQYAGRTPSDGIKKPLNAFLGELFIAEFGFSGDETRLVSEQVSHHPPVTACYLWNAAHGVRAEGYTRQEITFTGSVNIQQIGHAVLHIDKYDEDYLIPLPNIKVKGVLTGSPYPELNGHYSLVSSSGFVAEVNFTGKTMLGFSGSRNHVMAKVFETADAKRSRALYTAEGTWSESFTITSANGILLETYDVASAPVTPCRTADLADQDPWESRKAWSGVISSIAKGDMQGVATHKSKLEEAQRQLRKKLETSEANWEPLFFQMVEGSPVAERLLSVVGQKLDPEGTRGIWKFIGEKAVGLERPWRGELEPTG